MAYEAIFSTDDEDSIFQDGAGRNSNAARPVADGPAIASPLLIDAAQVVVPEGQTVVHVPVAPGETVTLPFGADAQFAAKLGDGNLAIKVGDVTIILEGYAATINDPQHPVVIAASDGTPLDIAAILAATDPALDIHTAAGPGGEGGNGADNSGAIFQQFDEGGSDSPEDKGAGSQADSTGPQGFSDADAGGEQHARTTDTVVNTAPATDETSGSGLEDAASIAIALSGTDPDGTVASFTITELPTHGTLYADSALTIALAADDIITAVGNAATVYFVPDPDFNGAVSFAYAAIDNDGLQDPTPATAQITVTAVNDAPVLSVPDAQTTDEDTALTFSGLTIADVDASEGTGKVSATLDVAHGTLALATVDGLDFTAGSNGSGGFTIEGALADVNAALAGLKYTPAQDYNGDDKLNIATSDLGNTGQGGALTDSGSVDITVTAVNDAPSVLDSIVVTNTAVPIEGHVTASDLESPNSDLTFSLLTAPGHGKLTLAADGSFLYAPTANYDGPDTATVRITDPDGAFSDATIQIQVNAPLPGLAAAVVPHETQVSNGSSTFNEFSHTPLVALAGGGHVVTWMGSDGGAFEIYGQRFAADGSEVGPEFRVNTTTDGFQFHPSAAALENGGFVVTWMSVGQDGDGGGVYGQRYGADGSAAGGEFKINSTTAGYQQSPSAAAWGNGGFVVTWTTAGQDGSGNAIYGKRFGADGLPVGDEFRVNTTTADNQHHSAVAALENGGFVVSWVSDGQDGSGSGIYSQVYGADGSPAGGEFRVNTTTASDQQWPVVAALENGGFVVTWTSTSQDGSGTGIYGQVYGADGSPAGGEFRVNTTTANDQKSSAVTELEDGGFVVTWSSVQDGSGAGIYAQRYDLDGKAVGPEFRVNDVTAGEQLFPAVTQRADGALIFTWNSQSNGIFLEQKIVPQEELAATGPFRQFNELNHTPTVALTDGGHVVTWTSTNEDGSGNGVYGQRYDADGSAVGGAFQINTTSADSQSSPSAAALENGGFVVAWTSNGQDGSGYGIYGQRYGADGAAIESEFRINTATLASQTSASVAALGNGGFVVTWTSVDQDGSGSGIYGQRYGADGSAVGSEFPVNTTTAGEQQLSSVAALENGGFVVTWESDAQDGSGMGIFGQRFGANGSAVGDEFQVNTTIFSHQQAPEVAALGDGGFVVVWMSVGQDGGGDGIYGQRYGADGSAIDGEFQVNTTTANNQHFPSVSALEDGGFVVTWASDGQDGSGSGIYAQRYEKDGDAIGGEIQINDVTAGNQEFPTVAERDDGALIFTWNSGTGDIAQKIVPLSGHDISGAAGSDSLRGTDQDDMIFGFGGDDLIYGHHGHDTLSGGDGSDVIHVSGLEFESVDGGSGYDVLAISDNVQPIALSQISGSVTNIEEIDISGSGANTLTVTRADVFNVTDGVHSLVISGDAADTVSIKDAEWTKAGSTTLHGETYDVYQGGGASVLIEHTTKVVET